VRALLRGQSGDKMGTRQNAERGGSERWQFADLYGLSADQWSLVRVIGLGLGFGSGLGSGSGLELRLGLGLGLGLQIVVYKLLQKATKCGSITWLKLTNADLPRRSAPLRILSCPGKMAYRQRSDATLRI